MELAEILKGESRTLEFKKELPSDSFKWIKTIVAFANGAGGKLLIGVSNAREVIGITQDTDIFSLRDKISDTIDQMCSPQIMFDIYQEAVEDKVIVVVEVFPGNATPYFIKSFGKEDGTFIRLNATTRNADFTTLDELELRKKRRYYDELPMTELEVIDSDVNYLCDEFSKRAKKQITKENLVNMKLLQKIENHFVATKAYAIFLGKHDYLSRIQCARFKGVERVHFIDKKDFTGPLLEQIDGAYNFVLNHINMEIKINGITHDEIYEIPPEAIREVIVNAIIHRNYMMNASVQVAVYDDRVEISSPGTLYGSLTLEEALEGRSSIRNKILASVCEKLNVIEGWGTGLKRIIEHCKEKNVTAPEFEEIGDLLRVNFKRYSNKVEVVKNDDPINDPINDLINEDDLLNDPINDLINEDDLLNDPINDLLNDDDLLNDPINDLINDDDLLNDPINDLLNDADLLNELIKLIKENAFLSYEDYAKKLNVSEATIKRKIAILKKEGKIKRIGAKKNGCWQIIK